MSTSSARPESRTPGRMYAEVSEEVCAGKTETVRDLGYVNIAPIQQAILEIPEVEWDRPDDFAANYNKAGAIRQCSHIVFRFSDRRGALYRYLELPRWREWADRLLPVLREAVRPYGYQGQFFPRVMLARLAAGAFIPPHVDGDARGFVPHKIHVPITTNAKTYFFVNDERHQLKVGHAYEVNNGTRHSVVNAGETARIHLVFEYLDANAQRF